MPFSSHPQTFPASGSYWMSPFIEPSGQSFRVLAPASVLPMNIEDWFPLGWTGWIFLQSNGLSRVFFNSTVQKHQFFGTQPSLWSNSHTYMTTGKTITLTIWTFVGKVMSLVINVLSSCYSFSSKEQASFTFMAAMTMCSDFGALENKGCHCLYCFPIYLPWSDGTRCHNLSFFNVEF